MKIRSLVSQFITKKSIGQQAAFPALFVHYFKYWARKTTPFPKYDLAILKKIDKRIIAAIPKIEAALQRQNISLKNISLVTFVGKNTTNGHAAFLDGAWWVWIPIESYLTQKRIGVFVTHEIIHAVHYAAHPKFYFHSIKEKNKMSRQLITEAVATITSQKTFNFSEQEALWADFISQKEYLKWKRDYHTERKNIFKKIAVNWHKPAGGLFQANDPMDPYQFRQGYAVALEAATHTAKKCNTITDLIKLPKKQIEKKFFDFIKNSEQTR